VEALQCGAVEREACALVVRRVGAAEVGAFGPREAEPAEIFDHGGDVLWAAARAVEVVVAQEERAGGEACALGGDPEGACVPEVQIPGRRRREPAAVGVARGVGSLHVSDEGGGAGGCQKEMRRLHEGGCA